MPTDFPGAIDSFVNPDAGAGDTLASVPHDAQHADANDAILAIETKLGEDGSADTTSVDHRLAALETAVGVLQSIQFPVGYILISETNVNPATWLGYGTWAAYGAGRVLVGVNGGDVDFTPAGTTGGAKLVASVGTNANESAHTHSVTSNVAVANHSYTPAGTNSAATVAWPAGVPTISGIAVADHAAHTHSVTSNVSATDHAYTPAGTNSTPTFTGSALAAHAHELPLQIVSATSIRILPSATFGAGTSRAAGGALTPTAASTAAVVALSESKSAGTPAGTVSTPAFTGTAALLSHSLTNAAVTSGNPSATLTHTVSSQGTVAWPAGVPTSSAATFTGDAATITHTVTNNAVTSGAGSAHTHTYTGTATSVVQPYIAVYFWKRTA